VTKIAYLLLCHQDPDRVIAQVTHLVAQGDYVALHFDARSARQDFDKIYSAFRSNGQVHIVRRRVKCGWGQWSLVRATLATLQGAYQHFDQATHFYLISGDCMPIKSATHIKQCLSGTDRDYIENHDFFNGFWINTGIQRDRLTYRHVFNERRQKRLYDLSLRIQRKLGMARDIPTGLNVRIGSQWWCLRRSTVQRVLKFTRRNRRIIQFFKTTWIPDEIFFQTIVPRLIPADEIENRPPTFLHFSNYGLPISFYPEHYDFLVDQDVFFARKIGRGSPSFIQKLWYLYASDLVSTQVVQNGKELITDIQAAGRTGRRFGGRFFDPAQTLRPDQSVTVVVTADDDLPSHCNQPHHGFVFAGPVTGRNGAVADQISFMDRAARLENPCLVLAVLCFGQSAQHTTMFVHPADAAALTKLAQLRGQVRVIIDSALSNSHASEYPPRLGELDTQWQNGLADIIRQVKCDHNGQVFDVPNTLSRTDARAWILARLNQTEDTDGLSL
jgi:hypothetical protein